MRSLRLGILLVAVGLTAMGMPAVAQDPRPTTAHNQGGVSDPRSFVGQIYARYQAAPGVPPEDPVHSYSDRLRRLFDDYNAWQASHQDLVGSVAFDWWTNSQDWGEIRLSELRVEQDGPDRQTVVAPFVNYGVENVNRFRFVRQGDRWFLDDVVNGSGGGDNGWTLSALLRERHE